MGTPRRRMRMLGTIPSAMWIATDSSWNRQASHTGSGALQFASHTTAGGLSGPVSLGLGASLAIIRDFLEDGQGISGSSSAIPTRRCARIMVKRQPPELMHFAPGDGWSRVYGTGRMTTALPGVQCQARVMTGCASLMQTVRRSAHLPLVAAALAMKLVLGVGLVGCGLLFFALAALSVYAVYRASYDESLRDYAALVDGGAGAGAECRPIMFRPFGS